MRAGYSPGSIRAAPGMYAAASVQKIPANGIEGASGAGVWVKANTAGRLGRRTPPLLDFDVAALDDVGKARFLLRKIAFELGRGSIVDFDADCCQALA